LRTSSSTNVGADKDSDKRQRAAIEAFAKHAGFEIVAELYDQAVSSADPIDARPAFAAMLEHIAGNGARTIIVETANRFARDRRSSTISEPPPLIAGRRPLVAASAPSVSPSSAASKLLALAGDAAPQRTFRSTPDCRGSDDGRAALPLCLSRQPSLTRKASWPSHASRGLQAP